jgi:hypothetical protein
VGSVDRGALAGHRRHHRAGAPHRSGTIWLSVDVAGLLYTKGLHFRLELCGEDPPECQLPPVEADSHSIFRHAKVLGDGGVGQILNIPLHKHGACLRREQIQRLVEQRRKLSSLQLNLEVKRIGYLRLPHQPTHPIGRRLQAIRTLTLLAPPPVAAYIIPCDRPEPGMHPHWISQASA